MSLVKESMKSLVEKGKLLHEFEIDGIKFVMEPLTTEELMLAESLVDAEKIYEKYKAAGLTTYNDTVEKLRSLGRVTFAIHSVNGQSPVDDKAELAKQFQQRLEFREELMELDVVTLDQLIKELRKMNDKRDKVLQNIEEIAGK